MSRRRRKPLPQEPVIATTESLSHEGRGIAHVDGKATFIRGALANEKVEFKYTYCSGKHDEGNTINVIEPSPDRVTPRCEHTDMCGGCSLQHMDSNAQVLLKQQTLLDQLKHFGNVEPKEVLPPLLGEEWGYRRKARLGVRHISKKERVLVGFREFNGRYVADIQSCKVLHPKIGENLTALSSLVGSLSCFAAIPQIEVALGDDDAAIIVRHLEPLTNEDKQRLIDFGQQHNIHIYLQPNKPQPLYCLWPSLNTNRLHYAFPDHDIKMQFHPSDFTQVNTDINRKMINQAISLLQPEASDQVLDLFCGIGNFTLPVAKQVKHVVGVEGADTATQRANENAALNHIENASFYTTNLFEPIKDEAWAKMTLNKAIIDPPRSGAEAIIPLLPSMGIKHIVYVSCNPATLARDAGTLVNELGYRLEKAGIMNMFPHTNHVESIALFTKE